MNAAPVEYLLNKASETEIAEHLERCDSDFVPPLSTRVDLCDYAKKIADNATRFEAWSGGVLIGLVAAYCNDLEKLRAYITSVTVLKEWMGKGIAACLVGECSAYARGIGMRQVSLEVACDNMNAIRLYQKAGFVAGRVDGAYVTMDLHF